MPDGGFSVRTHEGRLSVFEAGHLIGFAPGRPSEGEPAARHALPQVRHGGRCTSGLGSTAGDCHPGPLRPLQSLSAYMRSRGKLQQQISRPVLALAETAKAVSDRRDYSVRARQVGRRRAGPAYRRLQPHARDRSRSRIRLLQKAYDDLRQTQQAIMQQERLRAVGQMASGIAHDINNAISAGVGFVVESLCGKEPNLSSRTRRDYLGRWCSARSMTWPRPWAGCAEFYRHAGDRSSPWLPVNAEPGSSSSVAELTRARWKAACPSSAALPSR